MIYGKANPNAPLDQGDLIDGCPLLGLGSFSVNPPAPSEVVIDLCQVIVLTQTCDLANQKTKTAIVAEVFDAQSMVDQQKLKPADIKGPLRAGRIWSLYFLPAANALGLQEMIVDLRRLHTVQLDHLLALCRAGQRRARLLSPYREHFAKHFADSYCRIGLPQPFETL